MIIEIILITVVAYLFYAFVKPKTSKNFPPGPPSYPIVGSSLATAKYGKSTTEAFRNMGKIYGNIMGLSLGPTKVVVINGYEATKHFYSRDEFNRRPYLFSASYLWNNRQLGVFFSNGKLWQEQRRFTIRHLRDLGFAKTSMESLIHEECEECLISLKKSAEAAANSVIRIDDKFNASVLNILWAIMAGNRYKHDDQDFQTLLVLVQTFFATGNSGGNFINAYPILRFFPYFKQELEGLVGGNKAIIEIMKIAIEEHRKMLSSSDSRDLIDAYLKAMEENKDDADSTFSEDQLIQICADLFAASIHPTSSSIAFSLLHMLRNPDCQRKVHQELDAILGKDKLPSYEDRSRLPYTFATVTEALRLSPVAPVSVPHSNVEDVELMGYTIPKDTFVVVNFTSTNLDEVFWGDPYNFRPERFLDNDGKFIKSKADHVFGFGFGKRQCLGEPLARISNFIFFTAVMQRFKLEVPKGEDLPSLEGIDGLSISTQPFSAKVTTRV